MLVWSYMHAYIAAWARMSRGGRVRRELGRALLDALPVENICECELNVCEYGMCEHPSMHEPKP